MSALSTKRVGGFASVECERYIERSALQLHFDDSPDVRLVIRDEYVLQDLGFVCRQGVGSLNQSGH